MYCILICGAPASGKSTLARELSRALALPLMSKDDIKEILFDTLGFESRAEKVALGEAAMHMLYAFAETMMRAGQTFMLENNFEAVSKPELLRLLAAYRCEPLTVCCSCDPGVLHARFLARERDPSRHRGHVVNTRYPERAGENAQAEPVDFERFISSLRRRGMLDFSVGGARVEVDTTDFSQVCYAEIAAQVRKLMAAKPNEDGGI
ncbi:AAA family ATPase [Beduinella massiliensis]|uniref:AAA family ATPase n=1 Tax=Beduinella massiliensis TaxID=1852363 RepID=UPI000C83C5F2